MLYQLLHCVLSLMVSQQTVVIKTAMLGFYFVDFDLKNMEVTSISMKVCGFIYSTANVLPLQQL